MSRDINAAFAALWSDIQDGDSFPAVRPLLAHYTSISTLERILVNDEIWLSNPLYMNDMEELRFGLNEGASAPENTLKYARLVDRRKGTDSFFTPSITTFTSLMTSTHLTHTSCASRGTPRATETDCCPCGAAMVATEAEQPL
jgi:hypothetical protein